jgi:hypothetical protein
VASVRTQHDILKTFRHAVERDSLEKSLLAGDVLKRQEATFTRIITSAMTDYWGASKDFSRDVADAVRQVLAHPATKKTLRTSWDVVKFVGQVVGIVTGVKPFLD